MREGKPEDQQSEFNSAIATLQRIDEIKKHLITSNAMENYVLKFRYLKCLFLELVSIMNKDDDMAQRSRFREVREFYYLLIEDQHKGKKGISRKIMNAFDDWEIELKEKEQEYGLNMPKKADPRWAMAGGGGRRR